MGVSVAVRARRELVRTYFDHLDIPSHGHDVTVRCLAQAIAPHSASDAALMRDVQVLAPELRDDGIRVTYVPTRTAWLVTREMPAPREYQEPLPEPEPEDAAPYGPLTVAEARTLLYDLRERLDMVIEGLR